MSEGQRPISATLQRMARRIVEGLVVGVGAAITLAAYNAMVDATEKLENAREQLAKQQMINDRLTAIARQSRESDEGLQSELADLRSSVQGIVKRMEQIESASASGGPIPESDAWESLKRRNEAMTERSLDPARDNEATLRYDSDTFDDLDTLQRELRSIRQ